MRTDKEIIECWMNLKYTDLKALEKLRLREILKDKRRTLELIE